MVRSILLYNCETWPEREAGERMLEVFDNNSICRILRVKRRDCVPSVELRRRISVMMQDVPTFAQNALHPPLLKAWAITINAVLEPLSGPRVFGHTRWRKDCMKVFKDLTQDC